MSKTNKNYAGFKYSKSSGGVSEYTLKKNGLTVLIKEDHSVPVATFMVTYRVGSRNEVVGYTGSTHILEHMMFKESKNYPRNFWTTLFDKGARQNATTWLDRTNYYQTLPVEYLPETIGYEADRMRGAIFLEKDLKTEMIVVRNEYERGENDPHGVLDKNIWAAAFQVHPYHHSTIGWKSDIESANVSRLKDFYDTFYWPNNATATLIGDVQTKEALILIKKYFEKVPRSPRPIPKMMTKEPKQEGLRRVTVKRLGETNIVGIAYKIPEALAEDTYPLQILTEILGSGKSSRLYRALVDSGLATNISLFSMPFHDEGLMTAYAWPNKGVSHEKVEAEMLKVFEGVKENGVTEKEVEKAKTKISVDLSFFRDGSYAVAGSINEAIAAGDWTFFSTFLEKVSKVTPRKVKEIASRYINEKTSTIGLFMAESNKKND